MPELSLLVPELSRCLRFVGERGKQGEVSRWLGQAKPVVLGHRNLSDGLFQLFGYRGADNHPSAAVCCQALSSDAVGNQAWLALTPARFEADLTRLVVSELPDQGLVAHLPPALICQLQSLLAEYDLGLLHKGSALLAYGDWLSQVSYSMPADETLGRNVADAFPVSSEPLVNRRFKRLFNEMQMLLHAFFQKPGEPFQARFNGFWLHGAGRLPTSIPRPAFDQIIADWPLARALAGLASSRWQALPASLDNFRFDANHSLMVWYCDHSSRPEQRLRSLTDDCLQPLRRQLASGRLTRLTVFAERLGGWMLQPSQRWRFWRARQSLVQAWQQLEHHADVN